MVIRLQLLLLLDAAARYITVTLLTLLQFESVAGVACVPKPADVTAILSLPSHQLRCDRTDNSDIGLVTVV